VQAVEVVSPGVPWFWATESFNANDNREITWRNLIGTCQLQSLVRFEKVNVDVEARGDFIWTTIAGTSRMPKIESLSSFKNRLTQSTRFTGVESGNFISSSQWKSPH
jgi:hypothetical protein